MSVVIVQTFVRLSRMAVSVDALARRVEELGRATSENGDQIKSNKFVVPAEAVLLSKLNPMIPRVWLPHVSKSRRSLASTEFLVALPRGRSTRSFLYAMFGSDSFLETFATLVTGTSGSHQRVKPEDLLATPIVIPSPQCIFHFSEAIEPLLERVAHNIQESRTLAAIRDALLPKLISGEVPVNSAEQMVGGSR